MKYVMNNATEGLAEPWVAYKEGVVYYKNVKVISPLTRWYNGDELIKELDVVGELSGSLKETTCTRCEIGTHVTSIGLRAFQSCSNLTSVIIPDSVTSIEYDAFYNCTSLTSVTIPNSVLNIAESAFDSCASLTTTLIGSGVTSIGNWAFTGCPNLISITVDPQNTVYHSDGNCCMKGGVVVFGCKTSVIPTTATSIGDYAFYYNNLPSITIPSSVKSIGNSAFANNYFLKLVTYNGTIEQWNTITKEQYWKLNVPPTCIVHCTDGDIPINEA